MSIATDNWIQRHRINIDEYYRMAEVGVLASDARVELIEGEVIDRAPIGSEHAYIVNLLNRTLNHSVGDRALVAIQQPIELKPNSEPQPDVTLLKPRGESYRNALPTASDVLLLIEVSDTTLRYDRDVKVPLYARHGISEVWLIDINGKQLHCLCEPRGESYASAIVVASGSVEVAALPGVRSDLSQVLSL